MYLFSKKLTRKEHFQLNDLKHKAGIELSDAAKLFCTDHLAEFSWQGYFRTGLCCDISQVRTAILSFIERLSFFGSQ